MLDDGTYDVVVVDADTEGDVAALELTIIAGQHKGEVVTVRAAGLRGESYELLGVPGTLVVTDGEPSVTLEG